MKKIILLFSFIFAAFSASAQGNRPQAKPDEATLKALADRATQCVTTLGSLSADAAQHTTEITRDHLFRIAELEAGYKGNVKYANEAMAEERRAHVLQNMGNKYKADLYAQHFELERELAVYLSDQQIDALKDALTFGLAAQNCEQIAKSCPNLTETESRWVKAAFHEAREFALDAAAEEQIRQCFDDCNQRVQEQLMLWGYDL